MSISLGYHENEFVPLNLPSDEAEWASKRPFSRLLGIIIAHL
ncbi:hypothetical protein Pla100_21060 [Neorhodopirellula pilleata]|uniref:Uncharacterized protein n=1 Tax=Neorhodopirellula pilleata TaxID=2714738 RepID=A0A5C6AHP1_9BACT|nr:hypothetical protein Pla100_21060 [Neorhodopirellula pilleata]